MNYETPYIIIFIRFAGPLRQGGNCHVDGKTLKTSRMNFSLFVAENYGYPCVRKLPRHFLNHPSGDKTFRAVRNRPNERRKWRNFHGSKKMNRRETCLPATLGR